MDFEDGDIESVASFSSGESTVSMGIVTTVDERQKIRRQFEENDPQLTVLTIGYKRRITQLEVPSKFYFPPDDNWERDGIAIGRNTQITQLYIESEIDRCADRDEFEAFCRGIANNNSIQTLRINCCGLYNGDIFTMLTPFFVKNNNLRLLSLCERFDHEIGSGADVSQIVRSCKLALSKFDTLTEFCMHRNGIPDNDMNKILEEIADHSKMSSITICQNIIMGGAISALDSLLEWSHTCLAELYFSLVDSISDNEADMLAATLAKNVSL